MLLFFLYFYGRNVLSRAESLPRSLQEHICNDLEHSYRGPVYPVAESNLTPVVLTEDNSGGLGGASHTTRMQTLLSSTNRVDEDMDDNILFEIEVSCFIIQA